MEIFRRTFPIHIIFVQCRETSSNFMFLKLQVCLLGTRTGLRLINVCKFAMISATLNLIASPVEVRDFRIFFLMGQERNYLFFIIPIYNIYYNY